MNIITHGFENHNLFFATYFCIRNLTSVDKEIYYADRQMLLQTETFFQNVVSIESGSYDLTTTTVTDEARIQQIAKALAALSLETTEDDIYKNTDMQSLTFVYQDGSKKVIPWIGTLIGDGNGTTYRMEEGKFEEIKALFYK